MKKIKQSKGITLVALVITVIVLLILAGVAINAMKDTNLIGKSEKATEEYKKKAATEIINLKITNIQISNYVEKQKMPTLQELADGLCDDNEMEYVLTTSKNIANVGKLDKIVVGEASSIFAKLKAYPYEFEINSSLQLASVDGVKVATNNNTVTLTNEQYQNLINRITNLENTTIRFANYNNLITTITTQAASWTATEDCVITGTVNCTNGYAATVQVDGVTVVSSRDTNSSNATWVATTVYVKKGSVVTTREGYGEYNLKIYGLQ